MTCGIKLKIPIKTPIKQMLLSGADQYEAGTICGGHMDPILSKDGKNFYGYVCTCCQRTLEMCQSCGQTFKNITSHTLNALNENCRKKQGSWYARLRS